MTLKRPASETVDQRRADREEVESLVRMRIDTDVVSGMADNLSEAGLLFFTDEALRVSVELVQDGQTRVFSGRLVRAQRMNETHTGLAIEFDRR
jgi:hypothetical protein